MAQQHEAALVGLRLRSLRAKMHMEVRELGRLQGCASLADAIEQLPEWLEGADALRVIGWAPSVGPDLVDDIYARTGSRLKHRLGDLTPRQRSVVADALREHGRGRRGARVAA